MFWTPGHADIQGNEVADRLAKEAAKEAQNLDQNTSVLTNKDIKKAARGSIMDKWQDKWNSQHNNGCEDKPIGLTILSLMDQETTLSRFKYIISNTGREYFQYRPKILPKPRFDFQDHRGFILLLQIRTGYSQLNDYKQTLGQVESNRQDFRVKSM